MNRPRRVSYGSYDIGNRPIPVVSSVAWLAASFVGFVRFADDAADARLAASLGQALGRGNYLHVPRTRVWRTSSAHP